VSAVSASSSAPIARGSRLLAAGVAVYALLLAGAALTGSIWLDELAAFALVGLLLLPGLRRLRRSAWLAWLAAAAALVALGLRGNGRFALDCMPVLVNAALCAVFARTLARGREPLIARVIEVLEGRARLALPRVAGYARALTWAWALLLGAQAVLLALLAVCAQPHGLLATFGLAAPLATGGTAWRIYQHLGSYALVPLFLVAEYAFRRWYLRHLPHASLPLFAARLARRWPGLLRSLSESAWAGGGPRSGAAA
jgi:uncharacterized membrane protein